MSDQRENEKPPALGQWLNKRPPGKRRVMKPEAELVMMRDRVRLACATLRDAVGSNGPESIESFASRAAARIAELEARMRKACVLMDAFDSDDESTAQREHEEALYALLDVDP